ncbi:unnamed protein product [Aphis gossypii]|uniref:Uncharacterized protein n=1 Tax=Aphis gossypii TaxID=80765 RepID=A0A9P0JIZ3_APHGO|nr:unnamed protein product [Aphis gossypii]
MHIFYVPKPVIVRTNMSIFFVLLILVWSHMSGTYVVTLFVDGKNENKSTTNNESCITCFCELKTSNCKEEMCTDTKSIDYCKNKTHQASIAEHRIPTSIFSLHNIGLMFKMFICMCVIYMFIIHASGDCFESISTRRRHPSLNRILSDDGRPSTNIYSDDQSCVIPLNVFDHNNYINDPPPSYHDVQNTRTNVSSLRYTAQLPVQSFDLNHADSLNNYSARSSLTSPVDEPPPSYDDFMAIHRSKLSRVHNNLLTNRPNDHLYTAMPSDVTEIARDSQTTLVS